MIEVERKWFPDISNNHLRLLIFSVKCDGRGGGQEAQHLTPMASGYLGVYVNTQLSHNKLFHVVIEFHNYY